MHIKNLIGTFCELFLEFSIFFSREGRRQDRYRSVEYRYDSYGPDHNSDPGPGPDPDPRCSTYGFNPDPFERSGE